PHPSSPLFPYTTLFRSYLHPNGQLPAFEYNLSDVNPPVHAWACWRVYQIDGKRDQRFLERAFHKLLMNFTWWVNRKDVEGKGVRSEEHTSELQSLAYLV